ncbi:MAG: tRNA pseudouridine(13) synthase TruD [Gammaproteobacteria bacterium]|nr:tRNA pseudouridine(13) synthase TruD [Gammaproteobacteria bacterium]MCP4088822.1 tRNA pseudouridine(13) synthase TruD [Gammaproteobacteria bacterium]MCP4274838.1 tRNA pseudouridine(13) synthase TruD [Gammaproteobacteria bacterium]MCP4832095.1 tRNA pseudouridine(13) synthase TruD [Gammaproteobacteria bacterium]MCP4928304.1 tRNA pseudouridine(13) synthase TruD [Gammaproteobacteria bacterium]
MSAIETELTQLRCCADLDDLPRSLGGAIGTADYRCTAADFQVSEAGLKPSGEGEHLMLRVRKTSQNTRWVAKQLADSLHVPYRAVSYAGLKDRHAVTEQWFGVHLPGRSDPDLAELNIEGTEILSSVRHNRKLRPGQLSYNEFKIVLRNCHYESVSLLDERLIQISSQGVPNYFGPQRFGRSLANLNLLRDETDFHRLGREPRAFALSALRAALFNGYLAERIRQGEFDCLLAGEVSVSDRPRGLAEDDRSVFIPEILPTGLLWGQGTSAASDQVADRENEWFSHFPLVCAILEAAGSKASRRVLRMRVAKLDWQHQDTNLHITFALGPGSYATVLLRELLSLKDRLSQPIANEIQV